MSRDKEITTMRLTGSVSPPPLPRPAAPHELRRRQALELVARALGATQPGMVAMSLDPHTEDVAQAIMALRQTQPEWFAVDSTRGKAASDAVLEATGDVPTSSRCSMA